MASSGPSKLGVRERAVNDEYRDAKRVQRMSTIRVPFAKVRVHGRCRAYAYLEIKARSQRM